MVNLVSELLHIYVHDAVIRYSIGTVSPPIQWYMYSWTGTWTVTMTGNTDTGRVRLHCRNESIPP